jgi:hypothetical protein
LFIEDDLTETNIFLENLKAKLPYYMIPAKVLLHKKFPLNSNGKIDHNMMKKLITI